MHEPDGRTALHAAAEAGRLKQVQQLLTASRTDVNARNAEGSTPLHEAARADHGVIVAALLVAGADNQARDNRGRTALHVAASNGSKDAMQQLMAAGASFATFDMDGSQPLHLACSNGRAGAARLLLDKGAPVNQRRSGRAAQLPSGAAHHTHSDGYTPLHAACDRCEVEVVRAVLSAGAEVNARCRQGCTPLWLASKRGRVHVMEELLSHGADSMALDKKGWAPLHIACQNNCIRAVQRLLDIPEVLAAVDLPTAAGATPLLLAVRGGCGPVVSLLAAAGANMNRRAANGETPLQTAVRCNRVSVVGPLLDAGANPGAAAVDGHNNLHSSAAANDHNSLHAAAAAGKLPVLRKLAAAVAAGQGTAGLDAEWRGYTALHLAVEYQHWECVKVLVAAGADPSKLYGARARDLAGANPLHRAVQLGGEAVVPLLATPANLRHVWKGATPLHLALGSGHGKVQVQVTMVQALLAAGASPGLPNRRGLTPLQVAANSCHPGIRELVPAMVRCECVLYQQQQPPKGRLTRELAAVLAGIADGVYGLLEAGHLPGCMSCFTAVMDVLGVAAGSSLLSLVLEVTCATAETRAEALGVQLVGQLYRSWLDVMQPWIQRQGQVTSRLQGLGLQPLQQRLREQQPGDHHQHPLSATDAAAACKQAGQAPGIAAQLHAEGVAAVNAGQWAALMRILEQLTATHPDYSASLFEVAVSISRQSWPQLAGLCEALLVAQWAVKHQAAARVPRGVVEAVVAGVQAWQQLEQQAAPVGAHSRRRLR